MTDQLKDIRERLKQIRRMDRSWKMQLNIDNGNVHHPDSITILSSNGYITPEDMIAFTQFPADVESLLAKEEKNTVSLPKDVDITQLSTTYLNATIRDLEGQAAAIRGQIADLQHKHVALLQEVGKFERELEKRFARNVYSGDTDPAELEDK